MHYFQFHIGDYATHTRHLTLLEDLAYRRMLDLYYLHEQPMHEDPTVVARLIGMREHAVEVEIVLQEFFYLTERGWISDRVEREISEFKAKAKAASRAGKASAERRRNDRSTTVQPTINQEPITKNQEPKKRVQIATRLPDDWSPTPEQMAFCGKERPDLEPHGVAARFRDYWIAQPGTKGRKTDWDATWRNWVRGERAPMTRMSQQQRLEANNLRAVEEFLSEGDHD